MIKHQTQFGGYSWWGARIIHRPAVFHSSLLVTFPSSPKHGEILECNISPTAAEEVQDSISLEDVSGGTGSIFIQANGVQCTRQQLPLREKLKVFVPFGIHEVFTGQTWYGIAWVKPCQAIGMLIYVDCISIMWAVEGL